MNINRINELKIYFDNPINCRKKFLQIFYPDGFSCIFCRSTKLYEIQEVYYRCKNCKKQFCIYTNTIIYFSKLPLNKWLIAIYILRYIDCTMSSSELSRILELKPTASYHMIKQINSLLKKTFEK